MAIDLKYAVYVDGNAANVELARLHREVTTAAGASDKMTTSTKATTAALKEEAAAANAAAAATAKTAAAKETLQQRVAKLPDLLGKQAAAISLVSSSMEGMGGQVGKLVAGAGQLAAAYGAGGPYAAALVAGMYLVERLTDHWKKLNEEQDRALNAKYEKTDALTQRIRDLRTEVGKLEASLDPENEEQGQIAALTEEAIALRAEARDKIAKSFSPSTDTTLIKGLRTEANFLNQAAELIDRKAAALQKIKDGKGTGSTTAASTAEPLTSEAELAEGRAAIDLTAGRDARRRQRANAEKAAFDDQVESDMRDAEHQAIMLDDRRAAEQATADAIESYEQESYARRKAEAESFNNAVAGHFMTGASIISGASQQLVDDLIGGQERALQNFITSIMAQAGQALISQGIQLVGASVVSGLTGNVPLAGLQAGGAAALIAGGVALGGISKGIAGIGGGAAGNANKATIPSSSSSSSRSSGDSAPRSITIVYGGASGPTADHAASAVTSTMRRAADRNMDRTRTR